MKRLLLMLSVIMFVFTISVGEVYSAPAAGAVASTTGTAGTTANTYTGLITIAAATFARQTAAVTFTTSSSVYLGAYSSASGENYTVTGGHQSGDKSYAMSSGGGTLYYTTKTAGASAVTAAPVITDAGALTTTGWTGM